MKAKLIKEIVAKNISWYFDINQYYDFIYDGDFLIKDNNGNVRMMLDEKDFFEYFESGEALRKIREAKLKRTLKKK